jgi:hypothetical protein
MILSDSEDASTRFERLRSHHPATAAPLDARCTVDERQYQSTGRDAQLLHASLRVKRRKIGRVDAIQLAVGEQYSMEKTLGLDDVLLQVVKDAVTRRHEPQNLRLTGCTLFFRMPFGRHKRFVDVMGSDKQCEVDQESLARPLYDAGVDFRGSEETSRSSALLHPPMSTMATSLADPSLRY